MMHPPWMSITLLLVSFCGKFTDARVRPLVPPPPSVLAAEGITPEPVPFIPVIGTSLSRDGWTVTADSAQDGNAASNVLDGNTGTFWHTEYSPTLVPLPHTIIIDMNNINVLDGVTYLPRQDGNYNGNIGEHEVYTSIDGNDYTLAAFGTWLDDETEKSADFEPTPARYVKIVALTEAGNRGPWSSAAEINAYGVESFASRDGWTATADSWQDVHTPANALDGDASTYWHTEWTPTNAPLPHMITINMQATYIVDTLAYNPRQDGSSNGNIGQYQIFTSTDGTNFQQVTSGTWADDSTMKLATFTPVQASFIRLVGITEAGNRGPWSSASEIYVSARTLLPRVNWSATADSTQDVHVPDNVLDGSGVTYWHTEWTPTDAPLPHMIIIDMQEVIQNVDSLYYLPRQDGSPNGRIGVYQVLVSTDGTNFVAVTTGIWPDDASQKVAYFVPTSARYIQLAAYTEAGARGPWSSAGEINVSNGGGYIPSPNGKGQWGPTINFPLVPVAASVQPNTGRVVAWASWSAVTFSQNLGQTVTALYDPATQKVTQRVVTNTGQDMFCPGISIDGNGRTLVTGGDTSQKASIYDPSSDSWSSASDMNIPRGYQASATCSDGRIFTIGGSWSGGVGGKNGEIYNPSSNTWSLLGGCPVAPMLTNDAQGVWRQDNHGWLFGWKNGYVFQAGPSMAMNWYGTSGSGSQTGVGTRASDADSMCGNAIMYDAVAGKILTVGGSPDYQSAAASTAAHLITIGNPGSTPQVTTLTSMAYPRIFHNSVVLPDGTVFTSGGQSIGAPFYDINLQFTPELWDPTTGQFTQLVPNSTPRVYHSFALLLQDATVMCGGGGLCDTCSANHFDAQIYTPQYLLNADGSPATRPSITSVSDNNVVPGNTITVNTDTAVASMSLIRYGSATHTVNTDQRRIPLTLTSAGTNSYRVTIPNDYGIALPGYWMLFAIDGNGHPSVASTIKISGP
jgi:galactose oxidase